MSSPVDEPTWWLSFLRFAFWLLYNPLAWTYDAVSWLTSAGKWRGWQRAALPEIHGTRVLELAFGTGDLLCDLYETGTYSLVGLDLSPHMVRIAQRKLRRRGVPVPLVRARAQRIPFASASFDTVLSTFPAEFILVSETLREIERVLRPEGRAVIVLAGQLCPESAWTRLLVWLYRVTGQDGELPDLSASLDEVGLTFWTGLSGSGGSAVQLVILEKRVDG